MITMLEEISLNAWSSLQTVLYDGWILRFARGYTRRANSVYPLYPSTIESDQKILFCERLYQAKGLPAVFKLTAAACPPGLDEMLSARGYRQDALTSVQTVDLQPLTVQVASGIRLQEELSADWLVAYCRISAVDSRNRETLHQILNNIVPQRCFASLAVGDPIVACGLGVLQGEHLGLFDIVTQADYRRRGFGLQVVSSLLAWGRKNGAQTAYLQVMSNNPPALALYAQVGFVEKYQYWYRIQSR